MIDVFSTCFFILMEKRVADWKLRGIKKMGEKKSSGFKRNACDGRFSLNVTFLFQQSEIDAL
ncbi:hypothetical protein [Siminovitchia terrae]|uniref:hypothetical protein n=1 Tax=Siminovitchia terrae TaxID=1914933 RepID=UPI0028AC016F|nr:hypothetical protein [Siminovitchia terrae]